MLHVALNFVLRLSLLGLFEKDVMYVLVKVFAGLIDVDVKRISLDTHVVAARIKSIIPAVKREVAYPSPMGLNKFSSHFCK